MGAPFGATILDAEGLRLTAQEKAFFAQANPFGFILFARNIDSPEQLRINVTSPNGTTQAGLEVLMAEETGLMPLMRATVGAATNRSKELKG